MRPRARRAPRVSDGGGPHHVAEIVHLQGELMAYARVGRVALVVVVEGLACVNEERGMVRAGDGLQRCDVVSALGNRIGVSAPRSTIKGVGLLPEDLSLERPASLALLARREVAGEDRVGHPRRLRMRVPLVILGRKVRRDTLRTDVDARVKPRPREHRRHRERVAHCVRTDGLRVGLFDQAEAPKLALRAVVVAVPVAIGRGEALARDAVAMLDLLEDMHRERQACGPRATGGTILQVELRR